MHFSQPKHFVTMGRVLVGAGWMPQGLGAPTGTLLCYGASREGGDSETHPFALRTTLQRAERPARAARTSSTVQEQHRLLESRRSLVYEAANYLYIKRYFAGLHGEIKTSQVTSNEKNWHPARRVYVFIYREAFSHPCCSSQGGY